MAIKINFDMAHNPESPTILLSKKNGDILGQLEPKSLDVKDNMKVASEISFNIYKYIDNQKCHLWDEITDFKLIYCVEWDRWFEIKVDVDESIETIKTIFATCLGRSELSQIKLYDIEINTENDIAREDYVTPTILYNPNSPEASLLHRITEKAPHYNIIHVDDTIAKMQRTFTFSDVSIADAFDTIGTELQCLFDLSCSRDENGNIQRNIAVYDLLSVCNECGYRGEFIDNCPECGSELVNYGYGKDTTIFVTADMLASDIQSSLNTDAIKNCFKLVAGDDLMTATIKNCNPNGTDYIWHFSEQSKHDMSDELVGKINEYDKRYLYYQNEYQAELDSHFLESYNALVDKYLVYDKEIEKIQNPIIGFSNLINAYYNTVDFQLYLQNSLMPNTELDDTDASQQISQLTAENLSPIAVTSYENASKSTVDNAVLAMVKVLVDSRYKTKILSSEYTKETEYGVWQGKFSVVNNSDEEDYAESEIVSLTINNDYETYVKQKVEKALNKADADNVGIVGLFEKPLEEFAQELKKYALNPLKGFYDNCQTCIDVLIEQGVADKPTWSGKDPNLYDDLYLVYLDKLSALQTEITIRENELSLITGSTDETGEVVFKGLQNQILESRNKIQDELNFEKFVGTELWLEFSSFRREDKYSNENFISDGLTNAEIIKKALEFIEMAQVELYKSSELQYSIAATLNNLLVIPRFKPLVNNFEVGNWIRVMVDDKLYRLRLVGYTLTYDDMNSLSVEFSDITRANSSIKSIKDILQQSASMASSYSAVKRQAQQGDKSNSIVENWLSAGFSATTNKIVGGADNQVQTWDNHGMLFRRYDDALNDYEPTQLKIINSTIAITDDNWLTTKTAIGNFYYSDPKTGEIHNAYGVNGETIVGKLLIGESLGIYNSTGSLTFDEHGFVVSNNVNTITINPNDESVFNIKNQMGNVLSFDDDGNLVIVGNITARSLVLLDGVTVNSGSIAGLSEVAISGSYADLVGVPTFATVATTGKYSDLLEIPTFATVATTGSYNDLKDKPTDIDISEDLKDFQIALDSRVPITRTVNNKALDTDIVLNYSDVGADASGTAKQLINDLFNSLDEAVTELEQEV